MNKLATAASDLLLADLVQTAPAPNENGPNKTGEREKFGDLRLTASGQARASVALTNLTTLWFNTGTLCNIECVNCYIESSPSNDRLTYLEVADILPFLDEIATLDLPVREIGFTGGEPFMNPAMVDMARAALTRGFEVLILTNAMRPMMRPRVQKDLADLVAAYGPRLTFRVSLDHYSAENNDEIRGAGSFACAIDGMIWLSSLGARLAVAGRSLWSESEATARDGYRGLYARHGFQIDADDRAMTVLFPEMDETTDVPEITTACWGILNKAPEDVMCATSRMVVRHRGAARPVVQACTLLPYDPAFEMGETLAEAAADVFLKHRHCAKFCVLGGASCSA